MKIKIYKTIILPAVLYGCETWSLTLREESRLRVFENLILRQIFGYKRDENREWRRTVLQWILKQWLSIRGIDSSQERYLWGGLGVDGRTILEWTLKR